MSQTVIRQLLSDLGGRATTAQIRELAKNRYPNATLHTYVSKRLQAMEKWGEVRKEGTYWILMGKTG